MYFLGEEAKLDENVTYRKPFADWLTAPENKFFARAAVNRMWAHFLRQGLRQPDRGHARRQPRLPSGNCSRLWQRSLLTRAMT